MKVALDVSPLESGHQVRGVGFYLTHLKQSLLKYASENTYTFFTNPKELDETVDIVHYPYFDPFFNTLPNKFQYKTIITVHDLTPLLFPKHFPAGIKGKVRWQIQKFKLRQAQAIITDSYASQKDIVRLTGLNRDKVHVIHLAAAEHFRVLDEKKSIVNKIKEKYQLPNKFVLYVGDVTWNKRIPELMHAVRLANVPLVMVGKALGENDFDRNNLWNQDRIEIETLKKNNSDIFTLGFVNDEDLTALYNAATVFVWPSIYEGFGLPILEAMQSGCPVILSKDGCMPEIAGKAGYYYERKEENSLSEAIKKVFYSKDLQRELQLKGLQQSQEFSWEKTALETNTVYKSLFS